MRVRENKISGNALFMILIAIFLLGGLTVLMSRTSQESEETGGSAQDSITASKLIAWAATVEAAVTDLKTRGCGESEISFWYDVNADGLESVLDSTYNPHAPADKSCHVYDIAGAGLTPNKQYFTTTTCISTFQDVGTPAKDLYVWSRQLVPGATPADGLGKALCGQINKQLGNGLDINALPNTSNNLTGNPYGGNLNAGITFGVGAPQAAMAGLKSACIRDGVHYVFYHIVMTR